MSILNESLYTSFTINLTDRCNLRCRYCSRNSSPSKKNVLNFIDVKRVLDFFRSKSNREKLVVQFTGGEVFLHKHIFEIIKYALALQYVVRLQTNGTLLSKLHSDQLTILANENVVIKISLDGWNEKVHGLYRSRESFQAIVNGIYAIRLVTPRIGLKTVIHEQNFPEINRMLDFCLELGIKSWSHNLLKKKGRCTSKGSIGALDVVKKLIPYYNQPQYKSLLGGSNVFAYYLLNLWGVKSLPIYFFINSDGVIYLTDDINSLKRTGSIYAKNLNNEFSMENATEIPDRRVPDEILEYVKDNLNL